jgi:uncharacterized membrane protein HdeD (DUF308 family)
MAAAPPDNARQIYSALGAAAQRHWRLFVFEGIVLIVLGSLALLAPVMASIAATVFFGSLLLVAGIVGLIVTLRSRHAPGFGWSLVSAFTAIVAGVLLLGWPVQGTFSLTAVLIAFLFVEGIASIMYALGHRQEGSGRWGWMLASAILDLVLGGILFAGLPGSALWAIGIIVGVDLIFGGYALVALGLHARHAGQPSGTPAT